MGSMNSHREEELLVAERAADWLRRLETADAGERAAFMAWLKESPRHVREILLAGAWDQVLESFDSHKHVDIDALMAQGDDLSAFPLRGKPVAAVDGSVPLLSPAERFAFPTRRGTPRRWVRWAAGCASAAVVLLGVAVWRPLDIFGRTYATAVGEQRAFELEDGSMVHLNARSRVKVDFSDHARMLYLLEGQAIFKVRHEPARPFRVHVNGAFIQAVGTQFDVHRRASRTTVAVIEGKVKVSAASDANLKGMDLPDGKKVTMLAAGQAANIAAGGQITRAALDVTEATAWQQRRLVFRKDTLADMAAEFNRYNRAPHLRVESAALRARMFNGVFDADDPESLLRFLEDMDGIAVDRRDQEIVIRPP